MFHTAHHRRQALEQRRQLHARIARSRRRIDGHTSRLVQGGFLPGSWRRQIEGHPVIALATAAGAGMLLAQIGARRGAASRTADGLAAWLAGGTCTTLMKQVERFLASGEASQPPPATEPENV